MAASPVAVGLATNTAAATRATSGRAGPRAVERALRAGRLYAVIEAWGTPTGFDFHLSGPEGPVEMGETVAFRPGQRIVIEPPKVHDRSPALPAPEIRLRLYRLHDGRRQILVDDRDRVDLAVPGPGTYRVEVGIVPRHLTPYLGRSAGRYLREVPWIYSNPIRVVAPGGSATAPRETP